VTHAVVVYTIRAEFPDDTIRQQYLDWLCGGHSAKLVRAGGALGAEVTVLDDGAVESRYLFSSRGEFDAYQMGPAIELRADGARRFPPESGVSMTRSLGERVLHFPD
jgi:hypothetical protein